MRREEHCRDSVNTNLIIPIPISPPDVDRHLKLYFRSMVDSVHTLSLIAQVLENELFFHINFSIFSSFTLCDRENGKCVCVRLKLCNMQLFIVLICSSYFFSSTFFSISLKLSEKDKLEL